MFLHAQGMADAPTGPLDLPGVIDKLGFVQLDTIRVSSVRIITFSGAETYIIVRACSTNCSPRTVRSSSISPMTPRCSR